MRTTLVAALFASCALVIPSAAHAIYDPLGSGQTKIVLDKDFVAFLKQNGIRLEATQGAKRKGQALSLPVSGGFLDPTLGKGEIDQQGTLIFAIGAKRVVLRRVTVKTKHSPLIAKVGGGQLKVASAAKISSKRAGFGAVFSAQKLKLTAKAVTRLNKKLRPPTPFYTGQPLGKLTSETQPQLASILEASRATLVFDSTFLAKLQSRFVSLNPIFPAEHVGATFTFPIIKGGQLAPSGTEGTLRTGGDLEALQLGGGQVFWHETWLDLGARQDTAEVDVEPTPSFPGKLGRVAVAALGPGAFAANPAARTITLAGAPLTLSPSAAQTFNEAFAQGEAPPFAAGEALGTFSFTAQAQ